MHLVGFIIRIYHDARSPERQSDGHLSPIGQYYLHNFRIFIVVLVLIDVLCP